MVARQLLLVLPVDANAIARDHRLEPTFGPLLALHFVHQDQAGANHGFQAEAVAQSFKVAAGHLTVHRFHDFRQGGFARTCDAVPPGGLAVDTRQQGHAALLLEQVDDARVVVGLAEELGESRVSRQRLGLVCMALPATTGHPDRVGHAQGGIRSEHMETAGKDFHVAVCHRHDGPLGLGWHGVFLAQPKGSHVPAVLGELGAAREIGVAVDPIGCHTHTFRVADRLPVGTVPMVYDLAGAAGGLARPQAIDAFGGAAGKQDGERRWLALALSINRVAVELLVLLCLQVDLAGGGFRTQETRRFEWHDVAWLFRRRVDSLPFWGHIGCRHCCWLLSNPRPGRWGFVVVGGQACSGSARESGFQGAANELALCHLVFGRGETKAFGQGAFDPNVLFHAGADAVSRRRRGMGGGVHGGNSEGERFGVSHMGDTSTQPLQELSATHGF